MWYKQESKGKGFFQISNVISVLSRNAIILKLSTNMEIKFEAEIVARLTFLLNIQCTCRSKRKTIRTK